MAPRRLGEVSQALAPLLIRGLVRLSDEKGLDRISNPLIPFISS